VKVATIDIGSNSIHLLIVEVDDQGQFRPIDREREMVRLGEHGLTVGHLAPEAIERALATLARYAELAGAHGCRKIVATATSAVRESDNGDKFLQRVRRRTGIKVEVLSGVEEARLIAGAVGYVRDLGEARTLGIDIGGGSTEFWISHRGENLYLGSNRLGAVRLTDAFVRADPLSKRGLERLKGFVIGTLARTSREVAAVGFDRVVLTSGTSATLAEIASALEREVAGATRVPSPQATEGLELGADALRRVTKLVTKLPLRERLRVPGLPAERADIIAAGAVLLDTIYDELGVRTAETCDWALREGVLINYLEARFPPAARAEAEEGLEVGDIRRRSILALARRYGNDPSHARHTTRLATALFDQLAPLHGLGRAARELLQAAAYLHDVGYAVSHTVHNKHGQYLVMNSELLGFSSRELSIVGNVVRYHGGRRPKKKHVEFRRLAAEDRRAARWLSAILTVADALDRSGRGAVAGVDVELGEDAVRFRVAAARDCALEMWDARRKAPVFEQVFGVATSFVLDTRPVAVSA
jgi:exopolyphosphatase/guanosine-5'-triphosphate,3'-diphosphate pyrophosphatase